MPSPPSWGNNMLPIFCKDYPYHVIFSPDGLEIPGAMIDSEVIRLDLEAGNLTPGTVFRCHGHKLVVIPGALKLIRVARKA